MHSALATFLSLTLFLTNDTQAAAPSSTKPAAPQGAASHSTASIEFFERKVRPILVGHCYSCHSAETNTKGGLRVDDINGLLNGGTSGPAVVPGDADDSLLIRAIRYTDGKLKMPPKSQLTPEQIADLTKWINEGAAWPVPKLPSDLGSSGEQYARQRREHWAWQPLAKSSMPEVKSAEWSHDPIDRFVFAELERRKLQPTAVATPAALLRRITFDLTGLPPTVEELDAFLKDPSTSAYEKLVDRLLASPAFGERWGRHWLDVARYAESTGPSRNIPYPQAWRYRDYVIDALNRDKPYDRFVREQVAGDLLPAADDKQRAEQLIATGFLALGVKDVNQRFKVRFTMDNIDEQIDTVTRSLLALTASCARCHDHKFDPIPATDYYALAGIFESTDLCAGVRNKMGGGGLDYYDTKMLLTIGPPKPLDAKQQAELDGLKSKLASARSELQKLVEDPDKKTRGANGEKKLKQARQKVNRMQAEIVALSDPAVNTDVALGVRDAAKIRDTELRIRGEAEQLGPVVPRGFLGLLPISTPTKIGPQQSGRLELAHWLTSVDNPLTPRVLVNRVWHHLFDRGLVSSVDNFGTTGDRPSHPELLDHLAARFRQDGWSVKKLVRAIVLSRTYRAGAEAIAADVAVDPANRYLWRHTPRRLDAEELRDAALAIAGKLNRKRPTASPASELKVIELPNNGALAKQLAMAARAADYRSVYLPLVRDVTPISLEVFDFAQQATVTGSRDVTTVAPQALYSLNDPFIAGQSHALATRLLTDTKLDDPQRITAAYRAVLGRPATEQDRARVKSFLADYEASVRKTQNDAKKAKPTVAAGAVAVTAEKPNGAKNAGPKPPPDPDEVVAEPDPIEVAPPTLEPKEAAWTAFCQALLGTAEFRYLK